MIIDGRKMAAEVLARAKARAQVLPHPPRVLALVANETPATKSYLAIKAKRAADAGCVLEVRQFPESVSAEELKSAITQSDVDAIIVQLPLPNGIDTKEVCDAIPIGKDADVLSSVARANFEMKGLRNPSLLPPVVGAIAEIFCAQGIEPGEKKAVVIGRGFLVGAPVATWLAREGAHVTVLTRTSEDFAAVLRTADIIVSGAGSPHLIKPDMLKDGAVLIDAGTSESGGAIKGDADPACAPMCSLFTPVPGGVGPLAVACLFSNAVTLAERVSPQGDALR
ncbi:MAG: bifunctional 5,10-methylenetetrahydrofolate dehydrogenase/5,10-methenyltetrahydrofolate cyclohydrolase [Candidatus Parcubacteria bacterium]|nr:bifunctional 5,10-methylenetetrahydrofolate dehydrogenase/5,10-methenyltetrahydrofolate cyclohydrolase [Candidatus Parcubacteria bacterium]